ncbi:Increased rDNA silencing protein 4 [Cyphellophora attinorum]|uniref:Increased rDNA silencing protein 4 n=1 Tax=Cyphellophora attinorum TaxID=1664694 RepID=A0A0N1NY36_9EURO|nr:Increased rDNA silencing protein 4 [Phialophora attinorum]KPI38057.1 Increased rDNA silencing protein 4 [Phialophora attinorum]
MTDSRKWRPPVAPKPSLQVPTARQRDVSPALQGAALAFSPPPKPAAAAQTPTTINALGAATVAERANREQIRKHTTGERDSTSPVRGRSYLIPQRTAENDTISKHPLQRTASEIAAKAASANSSPARGPPVKRRERPPIIPTRSSSRESFVRRGRSPLNDTFSAVDLPVANGSLASPSSQPQLDLDRVPQLAQPTSRGIMPPSPEPRPAPKVAPKPPVSRSFLPDINSSTISRSEPPPKPPSKRQPNKARKVDPTVEAVNVSTYGSTEPEEELETYQHVKVPQAQQESSRPISIPLRPVGGTSPRHVDQSPRSFGTSMTAQRLADAMVASSLASSRQGSRATSPLKHPPALPRRRSHSMDFLRASHTGDRKAPLKPPPRRAMKQTLRKHSPEPEEEDETKRGRRHIIRKHPNKHHEGDRKRWRDKVTERERKRYEGVWAANRGFLHEFESDTVRRKWPRDANADDMVLNVVVQEVWNRSRLPYYALEEIWTLVAGSANDMALTRDQFVVGLWLVDQRLKGRKLPVKVSPSVWASVRNVGIKVKKHY